MLFRTEDDKKHNYGISIIRVIMTFEVVLVHCVDFEKCKGIEFKALEALSSQAVPVFMIMSFFFSYKIFIKNSKFSLYKRIKMLIIPQVGWALLYFFILYIIDKRTTLCDLAWQIITGHSPKINPTMWFQTSLIILTIFFYHLFNAYKERKTSIIVVIIFACLSLLFQYSEINYKIFCSLRYELCYPLGRTIEMIPYASIGILLARFDVLKSLVCKKNKQLYYLIPAFFLFYYFEKRIYNPNGFGYQGIRHIVSDVILFISFGTLRINNKFSKIIIKVTKHTSGVYYAHRLVNDVIILQKPIEAMNYGYSSLFKCIIIYFVCFELSHFISSLPNKTINELITN